MISLCLNVIAASAMAIDWANIVTAEKYTDKAIKGRIGLTISRKGVAVTAFGPNPDGEGTVLRFWEQGGVSGPLNVTLPAGASFDTATPVDLRGRAIAKPVLLKEGRLSFDLSSYTPASFILRRK